MLARIKFTTQLSVFAMRPGTSRLQNQEEGEGVNVEFIFFNSISNYNGLSDSVAHGGAAYLCIRTRMYEEWITLSSG